MRILANRTIAGSRTKTVAVAVAVAVTATGTGESPESAEGDDGRALA